MESKTRMPLINNSEIGKRSIYTKPSLKEFGLIVNLTANGSGAVSEQNANDVINCAKTKSYVEVCGGGG